MVDRNGRRRSFTYDETDRQQSENWFGADGTLIRTINRDYDDAGKLTDISDPSSRYRYTYDASDRLTQVDNDGTIGAPNVVFNYTYDDANRRISTIDTINGQIRGTENYQYDAADRLTRLTQSGNGVVEKRLDVAYNDANQMMSMSRYSDVLGTQSGVESDYGYDNGGRLTSIGHQQNGAAIASYRYRYDRANRMTRMTTPDGVNDYAYDDRNQLVAADSDYQADESYGYDENGNRTNEGYRTSRNNRLASDGVYNYTYDREGNLTRKTAIATSATTDYSWDHHNRLTRMIDKDANGNVTKQVLYTYDVYDRRIAKSIDPDGSGAIPAQVERMVYDGDDIALTFDGTGNQTHRYLHGVGVDAIAADETEGEVTWALSDHQGTVRDVVDSDGIVLNHLKYNSFGEVTSETNPSIDFRYGYTGRDRDEETGLSYYRSRYYDPATGRFLSEDAIGFAGEDTNLYRYVKNHPVGLRDPFGYVSISGEGGGLDIWGAIGGVTQLVRGAIDATGQVVRNLFPPEVPETARTGLNQITVAPPVDPQDSIYTTPISEPSGGEVIVTRIPQELIDRIIRDCFDNHEGYVPSGFGQGLWQPSARDSIFTISHDVPWPDFTGRSHDQLPDSVPKEWKRGEIEDAIEGLGASIVERKRLMRILGDEPGHRERLRREEEFLRKLQCRLNDMEES